MSDGVERLTGARVTRPLYARPKDQWEELRGERTSPRGRLEARHDDAVRGSTGPTRGMSARMAGLPVRRCRSASRPSTPPTRCCRRFAIRIEGNLSKQPPRRTAIDGVASTRRLPRIEPNCLMDRRRAPRGPVDPWTPTRRLVARSTDRPPPTITRRTTRPNDAVAVGAMSAERHLGGRQPHRCRTSAAPTVVVAEPSIRVVGARPQRARARDSKNDVPVPASR